MAAAAAAAATPRARLGLSSPPLQAALLLRHERRLHLLARNDHQREDALPLAQHLDHLEVGQPRDAVDREHHVARYLRREEDRAGEDECGGGGGRRRRRGSCRGWRTKPALSAMLPGSTWEVEEEG